MIKNIKQKAWSFFNFKIGTNIGTSNSRNREEWIERTLKKIPNGSKILDAGAGELQFKKYCNHLNYTSQDFAQYDGKGNDSGFQIGEWDNSKLDIVSDITSIPVDNESFDAIMCTEVIEHVPDPIGALNELSRILKKNGFLLITAPFCSMTHFAPYHFCTGFNKYFYQNHLTRLGYEILELEENGDFYNYLAQEVRRINFVSKKYLFRMPNILDRVVQILMLRQLNKLSKNGHSSKELLCYGYHIFAVKK